MIIYIIDADLVGRSKHRYPNIACMKISGYMKSQGYQVEMLYDYESIKKYYFDEIYISKVFTDTYVPEWILELTKFIPSIKIGGTGFNYDKAPPLPCEIEHHKPDYNLYDDWVNDQITNGEKKLDYKYYIDYSLAFYTKGCFRKCEFCVNKNCDKVELHSPIDEFLDSSRKYISLLDDNVLGFSQWRAIIKSLQDTGKRFEFKQGMDLRLMTNEKAKILCESKYLGDYIFAFDNINDKILIEDKLKIWKKYCTKTTKLYVFCGFDRNNQWDYNFWLQDLIDTMERIRTLMKYGCLPYIMRYERYKDSPFKGMYITLARWCNQPSFFKKESLKEFVYITDGKDREDKNYASKMYIESFEKEYPHMARKYFNLKFEDQNIYRIK